MIVKREKALLEVKHLHVDMLSENGRLSIIRNVSFEVASGEALGIVGESGSGKTVTCLSLLRLIPSPPALYHKGEVHFEGQDLLKVPLSQLKYIRGKRIAVIFQEALSALNPVIKVGEQVAEIMLYHLGKADKAAHKEVLNLFEKVGISDPERRFHQYPHQLSGGLQQRVMIAMALACRPALLIADEPTTALDVTIQVQILTLLRELQAEIGMGLIFISHDLGVIAEICQKVLVMYVGEVVEKGSIQQIFASPQHPYTQRLLSTVPSLEKARGALEPIPGQIPSPQALPPGCKFHPRCPECSEKCRQQTPALVDFSDGQQVRCWHR